MKILLNLKDMYWKYKQEKGQYPDYLLINPEDFKEMTLSVNDSSFMEPPDFIDNVLVVASEHIKFGKYVYARK